MKRYCFFLVITSLLIPGCRDDTPQTLFKFSKEIRFDIPAGLNTIDTHHFFERRITNDFQNLMKQRNLTWEDIARIDPGEVTVSSFTVQNYQFIHSISLLISDPSDPGVEKEVAFLDPVPFNTKGDLHLFPTLVDLKTIFSGAFYNLHIKIRLRNVTPTFVDNRMVIDFFVRG